LRFEKIRIDETREQHPEEEAQPKTPVLSLLPERICGLQCFPYRERSGMRFPSGRDLLLESLHAAAEIGTVREAGMVGSDDRRENFAQRIWIGVQGDPRTCRGMVATCGTFTANIRLEFAGELANVVQISGNTRRFAATERSSKRRCSHPN